MTFDNGQHSGATPGGLIRGPQASPEERESDSALKAAS